MESGNMSVEQYQFYRGIDHAGRYTAHHASDGVLCRHLDERYPSPSRRGVHADNVTGPFFGCQLLHILG